ncbi:hypothetical protein GCM10007977_025420 [Dactylosporangium sucinum]|uniref:Uncharacterized protein n=1 Tax=Dactylosporangium sucinum TaxID=1424081 RepID=A0A917TI03_9ACTN|nr:hypothetical protein GCM10007977_025420 [Dactylosporangium sucinum]
MAAVGELREQFPEPGQGLVGVVVTPADALAEVGEQIAQGVAVDGQVPVVAEVLPGHADGAVEMHEALVCAVVGWPDRLVAAARRGPRAGHVAAPAAAGGLGWPSSSSGSGGRTSTSSTRVV